MQPTSCQRIIPRETSTGRVYRWLLEIELGGRVWRLIDGEDQTISGVRWSSGLTVGEVEEAVDLFASTPTLREVSVELLLPGVEACDLVADGHVLEGAEGILYIWYDGSDLAARRPVLLGRLTQTTWGRVGTPIRAALVEQWPAEDTGQMLRDAAVVGHETWDHGAPPLQMYDSDIEGQYYPLVVGYPGHLSDQLIPGTPGLIVWLINPMLGDSYALACDGRVGGGQVYVWDYSAGLSAAYTVVEHTDELGAVVSTVEEPLFVVGSEVWLAWYPDGSTAVEDPEVGAVRGAGDVIRWALRRSTLTIDWGRAAGLSALNAYKIDTYLNEQTSPMEWLKNFLPYLPIACGSGPWGIWFAAWPVSPRLQDCAAALDMQRDPVEWVGGFEYDTRDVSANRITISYGQHARSGVWYRTRTIAPTSSDDDTYPDPACLQSLARYGDLPMEMEIPWVYDDGTAGLILDVSARRHALPGDVGTADVGTEYEHVHPGQLVAVTDTDTAMTSRIWYVERRRYPGGGRIRWDLRRWWGWA